MGLGFKSCMFSRFTANSEAHVDACISKRSCGPAHVSNPTFLDLLSGFRASENVEKRDGGLKERIPAGSM